MYIGRGNRHSNGGDLENDIRNKMSVPTQKQTEEWRARWGSAHNSDDVQRIRDIVRIIQKTRDDNRIATAELIEYLKNNMNIEPIIEINRYKEKRIVPDLRGFRLDFIPKADRDLKNARMPFWHLESAILESAYLESANLLAVHLESANLFDVHLESANLTVANLQSSFLREAHLKLVILSHANLNSAMLYVAHLESANLYRANLESANFWRACLKSAILKETHLESVNLKETHLESADFSGAIVYRKDYVPAEKLGYKGNEQLIEKEMKADFSGAFFKPRFRHQLYRFKQKKYRNYFAPRRWKLPKYVAGFPFNSRKPFKIEKTTLPLVFGKLKTANFIGVSTEGIDWSGNRSLERYIKDQQFIYEFKRNHSKLYFWWNLTSKCGQSVPRLAFWIVFMIFGFALIFHNFEVVNLLQQKKLPGFWAPLYTSVNIFSNLGMGIKEPASKIGAVLIMIETMFGFVALGLLLTVAGSRFARRS